jgi:hypothetical protein
VTIGEAVAVFDRDWASHQAVTPRSAYQRTLRLFVFYLERGGIPADTPQAAISPGVFASFVAWLSASGLEDDADGTRKVAIHTARFAAWLAAVTGRPELDVGVDRLRSVCR